MEKEDILLVVVLGIVAVGVISAFTGHIVFGQGSETLNMTANLQASTPVILSVDVDNPVLVAGGIGTLHERVTYQNLNGADQVILGNTSTTFEAYYPPNFMQMAKCSGPCPVDPQYEYDKNGSDTEGVVYSVDQSDPTIGYIDVTFPPEYFANPSQFVQSPDPSCQPDFWLVGNYLCNLQGYCADAVGATAMPSLTAMTVTPSNTINLGALQSGQTGCNENQYDTKTVTNSGNANLDFSTNNTNLTGTQNGQSMDASTIFAGFDTTCPSSNLVAESANPYYWPLNVSRATYLDDPGAQAGMTNEWEPSLGFMADTYNGLYDLSAYGTPYGICLSAGGNASNVKLPTPYWAGANEDSTYTIFVGSTAYLVTPQIGYYDTIPQTSGIPKQPK